MEFGEIILDAYKLDTSILVTDEMLEDGCLLLRELLDFTQIEEEQRKISQELAVITELIRKQIAENAARNSPRRHMRSNMIL